MKKTGVINPTISEVIASMGHFHELVICDAGFPIPLGVKRIDLSLTPGIPAFLEVLKTVLMELCVENVIVAEETGIYSPERMLDITHIFSDFTPKIVSHAEFKERSRS